jgi:hypothetical protein
VARVFRRIASGDSSAAGTLRETQVPYNFRLYERDGKPKPNTSFPFVTLKELPIIHWEWVTSPIVGPVYFVLLCFIATSILDTIGGSTK